MIVVHYLNQFFSGHGGETAAQLPPGWLSGAVGPGRMLGFEVAASLFCGDDYFNEHVEKALEMLLKMLEREKPDVLICGPSFGAGRYGLACGTLARAAAERGIPAVCAMEPDSPGVSAAGGAAYIVPTGGSVAEMKHVLPRVAKLAERLGRGESLGPPEEEGYLPRGVRKNELSTALAAERAVQALLDKLDGRVHTEVPLGQEKVPPAEPIASLEQATVSLVSEGGLIPIGNPDRLPSHSAEKWFAYSIEGLSSLSKDRFQSIHGGFNTAVANEDPNRLVPLDALRHLERKGRIGQIHPFLYSTTGNSTTVANAVRMGREIAADLKKRGILAALLVGT